MTTLSTTLGQLTRSLVGSIGATCRLKIAKIVLIRNPRWLSWPPSWKSIFCSWTKGLLTQNLIGSIRMTCRCKIAKIILIRNPRWLVQPPSWKAILNFFWTKRPVDAKLNRKYQGCRSEKAKIVPVGNPRWPPWWQLLLLNRNTKWLETWLEESGWLNLDQK